MEVSTSDNSNELPDIDDSQKKLHVVQPPTQNDPKIGQGKLVSTADKVADPFDKIGGFNSEAPFIKEENTDDMTEPDFPIYKGFLNMDMNENLLPQETIRAQVFMPTVSDDRSSVTKGDPSLRDIMNRQVDLAEKQGNLLSSCSEAMEQQKSMFERMGKILKEVSLTQEKTSTSKSSLWIYSILLIRNRPIIVYAISSKAKL